MHIPDLGTRGRRKEHCGPFTHDLIISAQIRKRALFRWTRISRHLNALFLPPPREEKKSGEPAWENIMRNARRISSYYEKRLTY